ncbi:MAG TPA: DOMON-like domain-containing protein [Anaerolineales bacterium]|nr:DOMON-like domain-containing protein [Anaerolineales bacterium]
MTERSFSLIPFSSLDIPAISITGSISLQHDLLKIHYALIGEIQEIVLPSRSVHPGRRDELWMGTCFECFLAVMEQPGYWELNLAPSGDWNAYRMDAYRRIGFREEASIEQVQIEAWRERGPNAADAFYLNASVDLSRLFQRDILLQAGITAVIQMKNGNETYWALSHPAPQADFHVRESFILRLARQTRPLTESAPGG